MKQASLYCSTGQGGGKRRLDIARTGDLPTKGRRCSSEVQRGAASLNNEIAVTASAFSSVINRRHPHALRSSSGSLAMLAAIRRACNAALHYIQESVMEFATM
jgi:hypothetical protein